MATMLELQSVDWADYVKRFLDSHIFDDGKQAAEAIAAQSVADFGPGDTLPLEMQTIVEFNRREATEDRRRAGEWLCDFQAAGVR